MDRYYLSWPFKTLPSRRFVFAIYNVGLYFKYQVLLNRNKLLP